MTDRLLVSEVVRAYGPAAGVLGVTLRVEPGLVHALVGLNGAGKTTLMRAALGMIRLDSGSVHIGGVAIGRMPAPAWARVGHLLDSPFAYPELDVRANLEVAARLRGLRARAVPGAVDAIIARIGITRYRRTRASRLSKGNRQRLGLAAALVAEPDLMILDEPTDALDPAGVIALRETLRERADRGAGILVSSHHLDEVARIADRISVMNRGRIIGTLDRAGAELERAFFDLVLRDDERRTDVAGGPS
ncbi:ABC transporter ATP-binding protein [Glycomyces sp. L485]|uniref:ABC transporter ATP-binding protein n=1 Tax=Glycomyces sp. L485 TaxID=2909235 RepID=UPI001F4AF67A|nr:ABC transporter ATP-binding protein [Glycomyces sp. L485]MCH7232248.1 ABC transporter ATP-binding protein [Glycomyces sp. L485]